MNLEPPVYGFWRTVDLFFHFLQQTVKARMEYLTGRYSGCSANGLIFYSTELRAHARRFFRRLKRLKK